MKINKIIIGVETHIELKTLTKMFCGCKALHFAKKPNTQTCPVCLGLPGALPVPNRKAIDWTILLGLALDCQIPLKTNFDRKNYFYPDLPKGYQISQYKNPLATEGKLMLDSGKVIGVTRVHLEEDTAKLIHENDSGEKITLIDFNRSGVPLVEVVSQPDINSSDEAKEYLEKLQQLVRYLGISDADMEKGSMRCEPNVNLEIENNGKAFFTPITELKNINSFRFVKKAIEFEVERQFSVFTETLEEKGKGNKQTRGWDESKGETVLQRQKEEADDYRYFPDPDIPPIEWSEEDITNYKLQITNIELPKKKKTRFISQYKLSDYQAGILTKEPELADYFEKTAKLKSVSPVEIANFIINKKAEENLSPGKLVGFILSTKKTKKFSEEKVVEFIDRYLSEHPEAVTGFRQGKIQALGVIVGLLKKETGMIVPIEQIAGRIEKE